MSRQGAQLCWIFSLHPFRGGRTALWDLLAGSRVLAVRLAAPVRDWVMAAGDLKGRAERCAGVLAVGYAAGWGVYRYRTPVVAVVTVAWCVAG